ncbi:MAG: hypothetical protein U1F58_00450 [Burkholderiales bacterium]
MIRTIATSLLCFVAAVATTVANAYDESLSFRLSLTGDVLAVASGTTDTCSLYFHEPDTVTRSGDAISISSDPVISCFLPTSPHLYEVVANLGPLQSGRYDVTWRQGTATVSATLDTKILVAPTVARIEGAGQQLAVAGMSLSNPFVVRVLDDKGYPVAGAPVVIGPAVGAESGVRRDEFGFRGFNTPTDLTTWGSLLPSYSVRTNKDGIALGQGPLFDPPSSASLYGAKVQLPHPQDVQTFFSVVTLAAAPVPGDSAAAVVEYFNRDLGHYFMAIDPHEIAALDAGVIQGWSRSIGGFAAFPAERPRGIGTVAVCRFFSTKVDSHFFTADPAECDAVIAKWPDVWLLETRAAFWIAVPDRVTGECSASTLPVYRLYNNRADANHRFVTDRALRDTMVARGWISEGYGPLGVVMCALR